MYQYKKELFILSHIHSIDVKVREEELKNVQRTEFHKLQ
jgi:hypothetical protein